MSPPKKLNMMLQKLINRLHEHEKIWSERESRIKRFLNRADTLTKRVSKTVGPPFSKQTWQAGRSPFFIGATSSIGCFSIIILVFRGLVGEQQPPSSMYRPLQTVLSDMAPGPPIVLGNTLDLESKNQHRKGLNGFATLLVCGAGMSFSPQIYWKEFCTN